MALISCAADLAFVFAYANNRFSHDVVHLSLAMNPHSNTKARIVQATGFVLEISSIYLASAAVQAGV